MSQSTIKEFLERNDLVEVISRFIPLRQEGGEYSAVCPFHDDHAPSFRVIPKKGFCFCHACQWAGDLLAFVMEYHSVGVREAINIVEGESPVPASNPARRETAQPIEDEWQPICPVPLSMKPMNPAVLWNPNRDSTASFTPTETYAYRNAANELMGFVIRVEYPDAKITPQVTCCVNTTTGEQRWCLRGMPKPRTLYGLEQLAERPDAKVIITEGERCKDAAAKVWAGMVSISWCGGTAGAKHTDWSPLAGRDVVLWPDNDGAGVLVMDEIAADLHTMGATMRVITIPGDDKPKGWDVADAIKESTLEEVKAWAKSRLVQWTPAPKKMPPDPEPLLDARVEDTAAEDQSIDQGNEVEIDAAHTTTPQPDSNVTPITASRKKRKQVDADTDGNLALKPKLDTLTASSMSWQSLDLARPENGPPYPNLDNVTRVLAAHPELKDAIWMDTFLGKVLTNFGGKLDEWSEYYDTRLAIWFQRALSIPKMSRDTVSAAVMAYAAAHPRNECKEWMESLTWDGIERLGYLMSDGFGAQNNFYSQEVGRCFVMGMVARVMQPGCKLDNMPVFEGGQGVGKSTAMSILGGKWFAECHESVTGKDFYQVMRGKLLNEIAEMHSFSRQDIKRVKGVISNAVDNYRPSYGRYSIDHPRQGVFAGTTNMTDWNEDETGARRFWPILCGDINLEWIRNSRDQLFAEALTYFNRVPLDASKSDRLRENAAWWNVPQEDAKREQEMRRMEDSIEQLISNWHALHNRTKVSVYEIMEGIQLSATDMTPSMQARIRRALVGLGWESKSVYMQSTKKSGRVWIPPLSIHPEQEPLI